MGILYGWLVLYEVWTCYTLIPLTYYLLEFSCRATSNDKEVREFSLPVCSEKGGNRFSEVLVSL